MSLRFSAHLSVASILLASSMVIAGERPAGWPTGKAQKEAPAKAAAPSIGTYLILWLGADGALATHDAVACVNVLLVLCLFAAQRAHQAASETAARR